MIFFFNGIFSKEHTALTWFSNWLTLYALIVKWPELWTLGAISFTYKFSFLSIKNSTHNVPIYFNSSAIWVAQSFDWSNIFWLISAGIIECLSNWSWCVFSIGSYISKLLLPNLVIITEISFLSFTNFSSM